MLCHRAEPRSGSRSAVLIAWETPLSRGIPGLGAAGYNKGRRRISPSVQSTLQAGPGDQSSRPRSSRMTPGQSAGSLRQPHVAAAICDTSVIRQDVACRAGRALMTRWPKRHDADMRSQPTTALGANMSGWTALDHGGTRGARFVAARGRTDASDLRGCRPGSRIDRGKRPSFDGGSRDRVGRKSRLREWSNRGFRGATIALTLRDDTRAVHQTVQAATSFVASLAAVYAGMSIVPRISIALERLIAVAFYRDLLGFMLTVIAITMVTVVFGELVPRRFALARPERIAWILARPVQVLKILLNPFIRVLIAATDRALSLLGIRPRSEPAVTQEEISVLLQEGTEAGVLAEGQHEMIKRVFRFSGRRASALMTPRNDVIWIDQSESPEEIHEKIASSPHTRFPVCDQSLDNLLGIVQVKDLLAQDRTSESFRIKGRLTLPLFLYEGTRGLKILEMFKTSGARVAVVLDEYGTVEGLLTLTDILEAIVGDIPVADDDGDPAVVQRSDGSWLLDGRLPLDEFRDIVGLPPTPEGDFHTLAGLVVTQIGHIPRIGETFTLLGLHFEIVDMDGNRVDRILVTRAPDDITRV